MRELKRQELIWAKSGYPRGRKQMLHNSVNDSDLSRIDDLYGDGTFAETIIADRRIGRVCKWWFMTDFIGNLAVPSPIDTPANYVVGLYASIEKMLEDANPHLSLLCSRRCPRCCTCQSM